MKYGAKHSALFLLTVILFLTCGAMAAPPKGTVASFRRAQRHLEKHPGDPIALRAVLERIHMVGGIGSVIQSYEERLRKRSGNGKLHLIVAHLHRHNGNCGAAAKHYNLAQARLSKSVSPLIGLAICFTQSREWRKAANAFRQAAQRVARKDTKIRLYERLIKVALRGSDLPAAQAAYKIMAKLAPRDVTLQVRYGRALVRANQVSAALTIWLRVHRRTRADLKMHVLAIREIAHVLIRLGRDEEAIRIYRQAIKRLPAEHWAQRDLQVGLIRVYRRQGRLHAYIRDLERGRKSYPILLLLAQLYEEVGDDTKALKLYRKVLKLRPANTDVRSALVRVLTRVGSRKDIIAEYRKLVRRSPDEPEYALELAKLYVSNGERDKALAILDRVRRRYTSDPGTQEAVLDVLIRIDAGARRIKQVLTQLIRLEPHEKQHIIQLGEYHYNQNNKGAALTVWKRLLGVGRDKAKAHYTLAQVLAEHELAEKAIHHFQLAAKRRPKRLKYRSVLATYLIRLGRHAAALNAWEQVLGQARSDRRMTRNARRMVIELRRKLGSLQSAMLKYKRLFESKPVDVDAGLMLVQAYIVLKRYQNAARVLERIVSLHPRQLEGLLKLEFVYERLNRLSDSITLLKRIAELDPATARHRLKRMARLSLERHQTEDALRYAKLVVDLNPTQPDAIIHLADIYQRNANYIQALTTLRRVIAITPKDVSIRFKIVSVLERLGRFSEQRSELFVILDLALKPSDILGAGRHLINLADSMSDFDRVEEKLLLGIYRSPRSPLLRKLLVEVYSRLFHYLETVGHLSEPQRRQRMVRVMKRGLKPMLDALGDGDLAVRSRVLKLFQNIPTPEAVPILLRQLHEPDRMLQLNTLTALALSGSALALPAIEKLTASSQQDVAFSAVYALGAFDDKRALSVLTRFVRSMRRSTSAKVYVALALGMRGKADGLPLALDLFRKASVKERPYFTWTLGAIGHPAALSVLLKRPSTDSLVQQRMTVWALGMIGSEKALPKLLEMTLHPAVNGARVQERDIAMVVSGHTWPRAELLRLYTSLMPGVTRLNARRIMTRLMSTVQVPSLNGDLFTTKYSAVIKQALLVALSQTERSSLLGTLRTLTLTGDKKLTLLPISSTPTVPNQWYPALSKRIRPLSSHHVAEVRRLAVRILGQIGGDSSVAAIDGALKDANDLVRIEAIRAIGRRGGIDSAKRLIAFAKSGQIGRSWRERYVFLVALAEVSETRLLESSRVAAVLNPFMSDAFAEVRRAALQVMVAHRINNKILVQLAVRRLLDADAGVAVTAANALAHTRDALARAALTKAAKHANPAVRRAAQRALNQLRDPSA